MDAFMSQVADVKQIQPIIRRLDARQFTLLDYLVEIKNRSGYIVGLNVEVWWRRGGSSQWASTEHCMTIFAFTDVGLSVGIGTHQDVTCVIFDRLL